MSKAVFIYEREGGDGEKPVLIVTAESLKKAEKFIPKDEYSPWTLSLVVPQDVKKSGVVFCNYLTSFPLEEINEEEEEEEQDD